MEPAAKRSKRSKLPPDWGDAVARAALAAWRGLSKNGKPQQHEHTVLAVILVSEGHDPLTLRPVALATGTKCLPASKRDPLGCLMRDSHAEVLCRRAFCRFLTSELALASVAARASPAAGGSGGLWEWDAVASRFALRDGVGLHLYVSQLPCGDACVDDAGGEGGVDCEGGVAGAGRTGAKEVAQVGHVPTQGEVDRGAQRVGAVRRKPGKGEATLSMSCSDKILRWMLVGLESTLLSGMLAEPLRLASVVCAHRCSAPDTAQAALQRALFHRAPATGVRPPQVFVVSAPPDEDLTPGPGKVGCGSSVNWSAASITPEALEAILAGQAPVAASVCGDEARAAVATRHQHEATQALTGLRLGPSKSAPLSKSASSLCRAVMAARVLVLARLAPEVCAWALRLDASTTYGELKDAAGRERGERWRRLCGRERPRQSCRGMLRDNSRAGEGNSTDALRCNEAQGSARDPGNWAGACDLSLWIAKPEAEAQARVAEMLAALGMEDRMLARARQVETGEKEGAGNKTGVNNET